MKKKLYCIIVLTLRPSDLLEIGFTSIIVEKYNIGRTLILYLLWLLRYQSPLVSLCCCGNCCVGSIEEREDIRKEGIGD
jgi:hypothetical protein